MGETVRLSIGPYDANGNKIAIQNDLASHASSRFTSKYKYSLFTNDMDPMKVDYSENTYYDDKRLILWGTYNFFCYIQG